jgi:hypothetical protein
MARRVVELGVFRDGTAHMRWISIIAGSCDELDRAVEYARERGWEPIPLIEGVDVETGAPCLWMQKPCDPPAEQGGLL